MIGEPGQAAGAGTDFQDRAPFVGGVLGQECDQQVFFERFDPRLHVRQFHFGEVAHFPVGEGVAEHGLEAGELADGSAIGLDLADHRLQFGIFGRKPDIDIRRRPFAHARLDLRKTAFEFLHLVER